MRLADFLNGGVFANGRTKVFHESLPPVRRSKFRYSKCAWQIFLMVVCLLMGARRFIGNNRGENNW